MTSNRAKVRGIIIFILIMVLGIFAISSIVAGQKVISGRVFDSDGRKLGGEPGKYNGTYAAVIVEHNGVKDTIVDHNGLEWDESDNYWYAIDLEAGQWSPGDTYWIKIDGTDWGDMNFTCSDHGNPSVNSWTMTRGTEWVDVNTADYNFKPILAWIFAIILGVVGIMIGIFRPLKMPFSGWPRQPADLTDDITITGAAVAPEVAPEAVAPGAAPAAPPEEHICPTCGGKMEYIPEYDSWYCYTCQKYEEKVGIPPEGHICVTCGGKMEYIPEYDSWYCYTCQKYEEKEEVPPPGPAEPSPPPPYSQPPGPGTPPPTGGA